MIIQSRSILMPNNVVFTPHNFNEMAKEFKRAYKEENEDKFKGNVYLAMTIGIIQEKKIPDINDCLLLIRGGNNWCNINTAEMIYNSFIKAYPERGTIGCFCDMCKILNQDIPFASQIGKMIDELENDINKYLDAKEKIRDMKDKLQNALSNLSLDNLTDNNTLKNIIDNVSTDAEEVTEEHEQEVTE